MTPQSLDRGEVGGASIYRIVGIVNYSQALYDPIETDMSISIDVI